MNNEVQVFDNLKVKEIDGQVMFDAESAAIGIGLTQIKNGTTYVRWERVNALLKNSPRVGKGDFISEPQVYTLAIKAESEQADKFQAWLTTEVLPSIRRTGSYNAREMTQEEIVGKAFMIEHKRANDLQLENSILKPKAEMHDKFIATGKAIGIREAAKEMDVKQTTLIDDLLNHHYLYRTGSRGRLQPYAQYVGKWFVLKSVVINGSALDVTPQTLITPKGREHFYKLFYAPDQMELVVTL